MTWMQRVYMDEAGGDGGAGGGTTTTTTAATTTTATPPWHGVADPDGAAYIATKGWKATPDVIESYKNAEKLIGRDPNTLLVIPRADDPAGQRAAFAKLGMPDTADKYEVYVPEGATPDANYMAWAKDTFHKLGLTTSQAKELTKQHHEFVSKAAEAKVTDYTQKVAADKQALLGEWRDGHDRMMNSAKAAANTLGFTGPVLDAIEQAVGYAATMKLFAGLGQKLSEDGFVGSNSGKGGFGGMQTPAEAKAEWENMKLDPNHLAALGDKNHPGHKAAQEKQSRLFKIMYPD